MQFDLISDFHVEMNVPNSAVGAWKEGDPWFFAWHNANSKILVVAGDTANYVFSTCDIIKEASEYYEHVLFTDGNHEHYASKLLRQTVKSGCRLLNSKFSENPGVTYLNGRNTKKIGSTLFIGVNGWYDFMMAFGYNTQAQRDVWLNESNDSRMIEFGKDDPVKLAIRQSDLLMEHVKTAQDDRDINEIVIVTHTVPHKKGLISDPTHPWYPLNGAYGNALMEKVRYADKTGKIKVWCFGHTHFQYDFVEDGIRYVTNPRGYRGEKGFQGLKLIDTKEDLRSAFEKEDL